MKYLLLIVALGLTLSAYSQPSNEKLVKAIKRIEREEHSKNGEKVISLQVVILSYSVIPLRDWWKELMDIHLDFGNDMDALMMEFKQEMMKSDLDSTKRKETEKILKALEDTTTKAVSTPSKFDYVAYFKQRYEQTPTSQKVYEVKYKLALKTNKGDFSRDYLRRVLNMNNLADADVRPGLKTKKPTKKGAKG